jgi:hypothetical protein
LETIKSFTDAELKMPKYNVRLIEDNSLLLATVWKSLKPTIIKKIKKISTTIQALFLLVKLMILR